MSIERNFFQTLDGLKIHTVRWAVPNPRAVVMIVHGLGEHCERYHHVAAALNDAGYAVYAHDHRGHGHSDGLRVYFESFAQPVNDLKLYLSTVREANPGKKLFLYGHSMGSLISTLFVTQKAAPVDGFISSGSPLMLEAAAPAPVIFAGRLISRIVPRLPMIGIDVTTLSRDENVQAAYVSDPHVNHRPTPIGMIAGLIDNARNVRAHLKKITEPLLVLHGTADQLTPPQGSDVLYREAHSRDKQIRWYEGLRHEIHNEPEQEQVFADVVGWLDAHTRR